MPVLTFLCYFLVSFGPSLSIFVQNIWPHSPRLIVCVIGIFLYYSSLFFSSLTFFALEHLFKLTDTLNNWIILYSILNVISIEFSRAASIYLYLKFNHHFNELIHKEKITINTPIYFGISIGSGYSIAAAVYSSLNVLIFSLGPAVFGVDNKTSPKLTQYTVSNACSLSILNYVWTLLIYKGCEIVVNDTNTASNQNLTEDSNSTTLTSFYFNKKFIKFFAIAIITHLINTIMSIVFSSSNSFIISSISSWTITVILSIYTLSTFGATPSSIKSAIKNEHRVSNSW